jgi:hypothetical protein
MSLFSFLHVGIDLLKMTLLELVPLKQFLCNSLSLIVKSVFLILWMVHCELQLSTKRLLLFQDEPAFSLSKWKTAIVVTFSLMSIASKICWEILILQLICDFSFQLWPSSFKVLFFNQFSSARWVIPT